MKALAGLLALVVPSALHAQQAGKPLFASDAPIRLTIQGPVNAIARGAEDSVTPRDATLAVTGSETLGIRLSPRGITRRKKEVCEFPPLRVEFSQPPAATSMFAGQRRLKLVTHCRSSAGFQQYTLMEYSAYRLFNVISPASFKVRLATVDYAEPNGKVSASRVGFFIEDVDDVGKRNGMPEARVGDRVSVTQLDPAQAARMALFEYMIGNLDWSMRAGPQGEGCCHNGRLLSKGGTMFAPVPYDFDYSGLVDAPYAVPPAQIKVRNVRTRFYQGYCRHNNEVLAAAADFRAKRAALDGVFAQIPGLEQRTQRKASGYLAGFFQQIATDDAVRANILKECLG